MPYAIIDFQDQVLTKLDTTNLGECAWNESIIIYHSKMVEHKGRLVRIFNKDIVLLHAPALFESYDEAKKAQEEIIRLTSEESPDDPEIKDDYEIVEVALSTNTYIIS